MKRISARFYQTKTGNEPVREWLKDMPAEHRKAIGEDIKTCEIGWPIGMPVCRKLKGNNGLREVRTNLPNGTIARVIFCIENDQMILLHGFIKKSQQTPKVDLETALSRKREMKR
jgi:phage-related protein